MNEPTPLFGEPADSRLLRALEAVIFAAPEPLSLGEIAGRLGEDEGEVEEALRTLRTVYMNRGVQLVEVAGGHAFRTAPDLAPFLAQERHEERRMSRAAMETLAIIAYHQPVTRAQIEEIRGVAVAKGTLDILLETGWVRLRGRRRVPGRPVTFGTTAQFLDAFGLPAVSDLPGLGDLRAAGLLEGTPPEGFEVPLPSDGDALEAMEDPLEAGDVDWHRPPASAAGSAARADAGAAERSSVREDADEELSEREDADEGLSERDDADEGLSERDDADEGLSEREDETDGRG